MAGALIVTTAAVRAEPSAGVDTSVAAPWSRPQIALTRNIWRSRIPGPTLPWLVLYADGRVLYAQDLDHPYTMFEAQLEPLEQKALLAGLPLDRIGQLHPRTRPPTTRGGVTECISIWSAAGELRRDCIFGGVERNWLMPGEAPSPPEMVEIWRRLGHFSSPRAQPFKADDLQIVLYHWYEPRNACAADQAVEWPSTLPRPWPKGQPIPPPNEVQGDRIFRVPATQRPAVEALLRAVRGPPCEQPLLIDGQRFNFALSDWYPHQEMWKMH